ncbi:MAG: tyrosine-type recombinase/integrase [Anaerolineae bacterium]
MRETADGDLLAAFERYLINQALSPTTIVNYLADVRAFASWYARKEGVLRAPLTLDVGHIQDYRDYLQTAEGRTPATINRRLQALRKFCRFAHQAGWLDANPAAQVELLPESKPYPPRTLSPTEVERLMEAVQEGRSSLISRDRAILQLLLRAGLRVGELVALRLSDVKLSSEGGILTVRGKVANARRTTTQVIGSLEPPASVREDGTEPRQIPLDAATCQALRQYLSLRPSIPDDGYLFLSQRGNPISPRSVQRLVSSYARAAGLEGVSAYVLRHTCAVTLVEENGGDLAAVARLLGCRLETAAKYLGSSQ